MAIRRGLICYFLGLFAIIPGACLSQVPEFHAENPAVVPQAMRYSGVAPNRAGDTVEAVFRIYASQEGGEPLWVESQRVAVDSDGKYTVLLGAATSGGLPQAVFAGGQGRWLGISIEQAAEQPRIPLASVAYAMKAADAETLAGVPAVEFVTQTQLKQLEGTAGGFAEAKGSAASGVSGKAHPETAPTGSGATNTIPLWTSSSVLGNSALTQTGTNVAAAGSISAKSASTVGLASAVQGTQSAATGQVYGVYGQANSTTPLAAGVAGDDPAASGEVHGVVGFVDNSSTTMASGVLGVANSVKGQVYGVTGYAQSTTTGSAGVGGETGAATGVVYGVAGISGSTTSGAAGVFGHETSATGTVYGVLGGTPSGTDGSAGVQGNESSTTGKVFGVSGGTASATNGSAGVIGNEGASTGWVHGVVGGTVSSTTGAAGVLGTEGSTTGQVYGVSGSTQSATPGAAGVYGSEAATAGKVYGVFGTTSSSSGIGIYGEATASTGTAEGVFGYTTSPGGTGVSGNATANSGEATGVYGATSSASGYGVNAVNNSTTGGNAVRGYSSATSGEGVGVLGSAGASTSGENYGVLGISGNFGVGGLSTDVGILGANFNCNGGPVCTFSKGVAGELASATGGILLEGMTGKPGLPSTPLPALTQVFAIDAAGNATFAGNLSVAGKITKGSGSFKIDHPLDPERKYLSHSFVESPDMMNVYNGNITTDQHGLATVTLPDYFEALNRDFRYQLTVMGQFAQAIVGKKIAKNQFTIRTNKPRVEVSWQVTGIRQDAYANANRIPVEEDKPASEQGHYLHPEAFGRPAELRVAMTEGENRAQSVGNDGTR